jgi:branched-chain amino acid transport system permease protein
VVKLSPSSSALVRLICFGVLLVIVMIVRPAGLLPEGVGLGRLLRRFRKQQATPEVIRPSSAEELATEAALGAGTEGAHVASTNGAPEPASVVDVQDVHKSFGGIHAVDGLSFELKEGRVTGLIGPNGAGKSTVFNVITGRFPPDSGTVHLFGQDVTGWPMDRVARFGMVRYFQDVRVFPGLTVLDNVRMAVPHQRGESLRDLFLAPWAVIRDQKRTRELAEKALAFVGMAEKEDAKVSQLPFGEQKLVGVARVLATEAKVLLLDEPASGVSRSGVDQVCEMINRLRDHGITICIVEHNLRVIERVADHVYFMEDGCVTAEGKMQDLTKDERLVGAYFGEP